MNRFLVTIVPREGNVNQDKVSELLKKLGDARPAVAAHHNVGTGLFFLRTQATAQAVAGELRGIPSDPRKAKNLPVIADKDELLIVEVGENTIIPSEGIRMWLFRK